MRKMIEGTGKCPACGVHIGFINAYDEKREQGECPCCGKKLRLNLTSLTKGNYILDLLSGSVCKYGMGERSPHEFDV